jgi:HD-GYP domain-containing protein (c-di-GMP phosphodiesterase class II)
MAVISQHKTSVSSQLELIDERLSQYFNTIAKETKVLAETPCMRAAEIESTSPHVMKELLYSFYRLHEAVGNIHLLRDNGKSTSLWPESGWDGEALSRIQLQRANVGWAPETLWLISDPSTTGIKSIYLAQRVKNNQGLSYATLLVEIRLDQLYKWMISSSTAKQAELMVVTPDGRILLHHDLSLLGQKIQELPEYKDFNTSLVAGASPQENMFSFQRDDTWVHAYHQGSSNSGYVYYELLHGSEIEYQMLRLRLLFLGISLLIVTVAIFSISLFSRWNHGAQVTPRSPTFSDEKSPEAVVSAIELDQIVRSCYLAVEMKDLYTADHTERVAQYALAIYDQMGEEQKRNLSRDDLRYAGLLHDIGKVAIPDHILLKEGKLTKEEYERIKLHPTIGADMVEQIESLAHVSPGVRYHHERWDGRGYPEQLKGEEIPLIGRILAVADTFDAMISTRSYQQAVSAQAAYEEILRCSHTQFDPYVVNIFKQAYESGSLSVRKSGSVHP